MTQNKEMKKDTVNVGDTIYITQYFVAKGIIEATVISKPVSNDYDAVQWCRLGEKPSNFAPFVVAKDFFTTHTEAAKRGLELITYKRKAITKQLQKLDKLEKELANHLN